MRRSGLALLVLLAVISPPFVSAQPLTKEKTPEPLRPWIDWVLHGHEEERCPFFQGDAEKRRCSWPSRLALELTDRGGRFSQGWLLYQDGWVPLPGDARAWPQEVRVDGRPGLVATQATGPAVRLSAGRHALSGAFTWDSLPPVLRVPDETGLVGLTVRGRAVPFPAIDEQGRLWLQKQAGETGAEDRLEIAVHRMVSDEVPLLLTTRLELQVSGKGREVILGTALPAGFVPMSLQGPLPARIEPDGRLRAQVRPGRFTLELVARHEGPVPSLSMPAQPDSAPSATASGATSGASETGSRGQQGIWPAQEVWVFDARPDLRLVSVEGVTTVDPQQTTLPDEWKKLPAYLMQPGKTMTLMEKRRGDSDPAPDQLSLQRTLWLDFDGTGYTVRDAITGSMQRTWRLEMPHPGDLGRVAIDGVDQFITRTAPDRPAGVELRQGEVNLDADSRLNQGAAVVPAVGWDHDFGTVTAQLNLPPAWRLLSVTGVDDASTTWISSWSLLDLFLVLIASMSVASLWGRRLGLLALATLVLTWMEPGAPRWTWLAVLAGEALRRALPAGRILTTVKVLHRLALVALVVVIVPFLVQEVRSALYPSLERPWMEGGGFFPVFAPAARMAPMGHRDVIVPPPPAPEEKARADKRNIASLSSSGFIQAEAEGDVKLKQLSYLNAPDPKTIVQTGPGLPDWTWRTVSLTWRGPVKQGQTMRLLLIPPAVNRLLTILRLGLVAFLALALFGFSDRTSLMQLLKKSGLKYRLSAGALACGLLGATMGIHPARGAEIPPSDLLNELRNRLLQPPVCRPNCASSPRLALEVDPGILRVRLEVDAAAETAVPLPGGADQWLPGRVLLDGDQAAGLVRSGDGRLWLRLTAGNHQVLMEGPLPERDTVQIPLPLKPHHVTARATGWRVEGLHEDGLAEDNLQLVRVQGERRGSAETLEPGTLPPFVRVDRELSLALKWQVTTRVIRMTPPGSAARLEVPLLPGESVTTAEVRVSGDKALVSMAPQTTEVSWTSALAQGGTLRLKAPDAVPWIEVWRLAAGPLWHVEVAGIPIVHLPEQGEVRVREWRPWPGESVAIEVTRPAGLPGQSLTIDSSHLTLSPGLRAVDARLEFTVRSSRGAQHTVILPVGAELQSVSIGGAVQPIRQDGRDVTLPLVPGAQNVTLAWRQNDPPGPAFRSPEVNLGAASVNARTSIAMPADRWTLWLGGPRLGPAVLFWGLLAVTLLASIALGQVPLTPLRARHWFLLSLGLTQAPLGISILIVAWLFLLGWRRQRGATVTGTLAFNLLQVTLAAASLAALCGLFWSITNGLLGLPEMQISGNGSSALDLNWYLDRSGGVLPRPWVFSVPLLFYRLSMLAWALWLAQALLRWLKWGWECYSEGGLWRPSQKKHPAPPPRVPPSAAPPPHAAAGSTAP